MKRLLFIALLFLGIASCAPGTTFVGVTDEIKIPEGYEFLDSTGYGAVFSSEYRIFCVNKDTKNLHYYFSDGSVGERIYAPEGYEIISYEGIHKQKHNFICKLKDSDRKKILRCPVLQS